MLGTSGRVADTGAVVNYKIDILGGNLGFLFGRLESLHLHDRQWRDGPGSDEGRYVGQDEEAALDGKPQPANRLSAMGRCLWTAWLITHDSRYRSKAVALGWYMKRRLPIGRDGAY